MGKKYTEISDKYRHFIEEQHLFFVGTAMATGRINVSPKGMDTFRVISPNKVIWLNLTGSGNETATHLQHDSRMTIMFCAFEGRPSILRLYGHAIAYHRNEDNFQQYIGLFDENIGARQIMVMDVDLVQKSCGFAVPLYEHVGDREELDKWARKKGEEKMIEYQLDRNAKSIDGLDTGISQVTEGA